MPKHRAETKTNPASTLVLSGGGLKAFYTLGALSRLHDLGKLREIRQFAGTSAGALICSLLCIGYTPQEILSYALRVGSIVSKRKKGGMLGMYHLIHSVGDIFADIMEIMHGMYSDAGLSPDITFERLHRVTGGRELLVITTVLGGALIYSEAPFSTRTTPQMSVGLAVRMSCAVPPLVTPILFEGRHYCDGFLSDNFPVRRAAEMWNDGRAVLAVGTDNLSGRHEDPRAEYHIVEALPEYGNGVLVSTRDHFGMYLHARKVTGRLKRSASV